MDQLPIPTIYITSPTGDRVPVLVFPFPGQAPEVEPWEWFISQFEEPKAEPETKDPSFEQEAEQAIEDAIYSHLPEAFAEFKSKRVPSAEFIPLHCRLCGKKFSLGSFRRHLGASRERGKYRLTCKGAQKLLQDAGVTWDPNIVENEVESDDTDARPAEKKRRIEA
ncbi:hypothetical protein HYE67_000120 [Fusarium culmorum]|uniref:C2H2-type domain-containing protein n=1 Tax=Fusarium culmorum TaxID=5516 RepID=A0A7S8CX71_FUSCU|nr:hypothetical protein HYE67_000120 [Fusarium culmorum]